MSSSPRANSSKRSEWPEEKKSTGYNFLILQWNQNVTIDCNKSTHFVGQIVSVKIIVLHVI